MSLAVTGKYEIVHCQRCQVMYHSIANGKSILLSFFKIFNFNDKISNAISLVFPHKNSNHFPILITLPKETESNERFRKSSSFFSPALNTASLVSENVHLIYLQEHAAKSKIEHKNGMIGPIDRSPGQTINRSVFISTGSWQEIERFLGRQQWFFTSGYEYGYLTYMSKEHE